MFLLFLLIPLLASTIGSIVGAGGGVIIKPVLDMLGVMPVKTLSFCSGCAVLSMSVASLIRGRNDDVKLDLKVSTSLATGAVFGGIIGKDLLELTANAFETESMLGAMQSILLAVTMVIVIIYVCIKSKVRSMNIKNALVSVVIGLLLGAISSYVGIGGGPLNVAVLLFFFGMDAKTAAKNSIFIIVFSQLASIFMCLFTHTVPEFSWFYLILMSVGGILGAMLGNWISKRIDNRAVEFLLKLLTLFVAIISVINAINYLN